MLDEIVTEQQLMPEDDKKIVAQETGIITNERTMTQNNNYHG
jgi:hypothetical protein